MVCRKQFLTALALLSLLAPTASFAQSFMAKPMRIEVDARAGAALRCTIEFRNTRATGDLPIAVRADELAQTEIGNWTVTEPAPKAAPTAPAAKEPEKPAAPARSCLSWVKVPPQQIPLRPMTTTKMGFTVQVPRDAFGSYHAQIVAATIPAPGPGVKILVRCLIPIIVNVASPSARLRFTADDVLMARELATEKRPAGTRMGISVTNSGDVFERVGGRLTLLRAIGTRWVQVLTTDLPDRPILPGNKVLLANSLQRVLSSGKYRLQGTVSLSGRVLARIDKEVVYEGDPNAGALLEDVAVEVRPALAEVDLVPGATRSVVITLANPTPQPVVVSGATQLPPALRGVSRDELRGDAFGCADWVTLSPAKITLPGNAERRVRVSVACPREAQMMGRYYAGLLFTAAADDGQVLGTAQSLVVVRNLKVPTEPRAEGQHLSLVIEEGTRYIAQARFANTGQTWYRPTAELQVLNRQGGLVQRAALETTAGLVLPLGVPAFVGSFDIAKLEPGAYVLRAVMAFEGQTASQELVLRVTEDKGVKAAVLGEETAEAPAPPVAAPTKPATPTPAPKVKETKPITTRR